MGRILKLSMQCLYGEGNETWKYRLDLSARAELTATEVLPGKKKKRERERYNMKCWRGNISKDQGEVSEGDRVHFSSANAYLSPAR